MSLSSQKSLRFVLLAAVYLVMAMLWLRVAIVQEQLPSDSLFGTAAVILATMACVADARARRQPMVPAAKLAILLIWPLAIPAYLLWSRGWWGIVTLLVLLGILLAVAMISVTVGSVAAVLLR